MNLFHNRISIPLIAVSIALISGHISAQQTAIPGPPPTEPVAKPRVTPATTTTTPAPINNGAAEKEDLLAYADLLYSQKQYGLAARQYQLFIKDHPKSKNIQAGWFRLGECYLQVKQTADAEATFNHIVASYQKGIFVGSAAFRLAVLRYNARAYKGALPFFKVAANELGDPDVKQRARYYLARNYQQIKDYDAAEAEFTKILVADPDPKTNPFYEDCLIETARLAADKGDSAAAYEKFKKLSETAKAPDVVAESLARAGLLAATLGKTAESTELLDKLLKIEGDNKWKSYAKVGLIFTHFSEKNYKKVISIYESGAYEIPADQRPKMLLIVGHSYRILKDLNSAQDLYGLIEKNFRNTTEGTEAAYSRLQILHIQKDGGMPVFAQNFVDKQRELDPATAYIDQALLMKAEWHFGRAQKISQQGDRVTAAAEYKSAAKAYVEIRDDKIDKKFIEPRLYKLGWSQIESGGFQKGAGTLSKFLTQFPKSALATSALAKRGAMYQSKAVEDYPSALADFKEIIESYPQSKEVEFAMQQTALIHGHRRELPKMVKAYEVLLAKFPKTPGAAEAHYWIGVGRFDSDQFKEAIAPLKTARTMDDARFGAKASLRIVLAHYQLDEITPLTAETNAYLQRIEAARANEKIPTPAEIPKQVLTHLGMKLYDKQDFIGAETFLSAASTPEKPVQTEAVVWKRIGECRAKQKMHQGTIDAFDYYLAQVEKPSQRASAFLAKGRAQLYLGKFEEARASARESLRSQKEGRTNAEARLLMGDIAFKQDDFAAAAREYLVLSQIYIDKELTPLALHKAVVAYTKSGDAAKAAKIVAQLKADYPEFVPPSGE